MVQPKPENHVTRAQRSQLAGRHRPLPKLEDEALKLLEETYPPRCLDHNETIEDHLRYAGKVSLVQALRAAKQASDEDEEVTTEDLIADAEKAS